MVPGAVGLVDHGDRQIGVREEPVPGRQHPTGPGPVAPGPGRGVVEQRRFGELLRPLRGITPKVLTESLRAMERDGLVTRTAYAENPPRVEYALTPLGRTLLEPLAAICAWSARHQPALNEARAAS